MDTSHEHVHYVGVYQFRKSQKMPFTTEASIAIGAALLVGAIIVFLILKSKLNGVRQLMEARVNAEQERADEVQKKLAARELELDGIRKQTVALQQSETELKTRLDVERRSSKEKEVLLQKAQNQLGDTFKALSSDALKANQEQFLQLAENSFKIQQEKASLELDKRKDAVSQVVQPISESLDKIQGRIGEIEKAREGAYVSIKEQVQSMTETQIHLQKETSQLVKALRQPIGRGQWGEMQLRRVVEMAGMQEHCDFDMQVNTTNDEGKALRPDLVVSLPGGQQIVVDSKTPMAAYLDALEEDQDEKRDSLLTQHASQVRAHIQQLSSKKYQEQFETSPEFVVLFLPSEAFFSTALTQDSTLIEKGVEHGVILATPTTLIALLRAVAYGWRQQSLTDNAQQISQLGRELHSRISIFNEHFGKVGANISTLVGSYNKAVGSLDSRVLSSTRKFEELGAVSSEKSIETTKPVESLVRETSNFADTGVEISLEPVINEDDFVGFMAVSYTHLTLPTICSV